MRGVFCTKKTPTGLLIYINEQDFIDRPMLKQALGGHAKTTKPIERFAVPQANGEEPAIFIGWEFSPEDFELMKGRLLRSRFCEDDSIGEKFEVVK